jgi:hypothetical protein
LHTQAVARHFPGGTADGEGGAYSPDSARYLLASAAMQLHEGPAHSDRGQDDPRLEFIYREAVRGLTHQQGVLESLNTRAGNLIFATAFATSLLGVKALSDGLGIWDWAAAALLFGIGALVVFMLWPYYNLTFRFDPEDLLRRYVRTEPGASLSVMYVELALRIKADMIGNWRIIQRIRVALQIALILLLLEIAAWFLSIGGV